MPQKYHFGSPKKPFSDQFLKKTNIIFLLVLKIKALLVSVVPWKAFNIRRDLPLDKTWKQGFKKSFFFLATMPYKTILGSTKTFQ